MTTNSSDSTQDRSTDLSRLGAVQMVKGLDTPEALLNPHEWLNNMRETSPVRFDPERGVWDIFSYEHVQYVLQDYATFSSDPQVDDPNQKFVMINMDPPEHTHFRALVSKAFTPKSIAALGPRIKDITNELLDEVLHTGTIEIFGDLAGALPTIIMSDMIGVPSQDRKLFKGWSDEFFKIIDAKSPESIMEGIQKKTDAANAMGHYLFGIIMQRKQEPKEDLISALLSAEVEGRKLSEPEVLSMCMLMMVAGNETTTNLICNAVRCIIEEDGLQELLQKNPAMLPSAIEEVLRFRSPTISLPNRIATKDVEIGGQLIKKGDRIVVWLSAANLDPNKFPQADRFLVDRSPNQHVAFGFGIHFCIGAPLARLEAQVCLSTLLERIQNIRFAPGPSVEPLFSHITSGLKKCQIVFDVK